MDGSILEFSVLGRVTLLPTPPKTFTEVRRKGDFRAETKQGKNKEKQKQNKKIS